MAMPPRSKLFSTAVRQEIEAGVLQFLQDRCAELPSHTAQSPRAVGDHIQTLLSDSFDDLLGKRCAEYSAKFARRAMADLAFRDDDDFYYVVDVKTHRTDTAFNMPNLTSVDRLARFYEDDNNYFVLLLIKYTMSPTGLSILEARFLPIEFLAWDSLTVGALGWGQIQIANANQIRIVPRPSRKRWMLDMCDVLMEFYPREIAKIENRLERFRKLRKVWLEKSDDA